MTHKEATTHVRGRIKAAGIKARCSKYTACGINYVCISTAKYEQSFTEEEQQALVLICQVNKLTGARGAQLQGHEITVHGGHLEYHAQ